MSMPEAEVLEPTEEERAAMTEPAGIVPMGTPASPMLAMIERVALSPDADITKLEKLLDMKERIEAGEARKAYDDAMAAMQPELPVIEERGQIKVRGQVQSRYALWEDVNEQIKPVMAKYGFSLTFKVDAGEGQVSVTGILAHRDGHREQTTLALPVDTSGSKNAVQAVASSTSYGKRYTAGALLNLTSRGEDDDGKQAGDQLIDDEQLKQVTAAVEEAEADKRKVCAHFEIDGLAKLRVDQLPALYQMLQAFKVQQKKKAEREAKEAETKTEEQADGADDTLL